MYALGVKPRRENLQRFSSRQAAFAHAIEQECVQGSAIDPLLVSANVRICSDLEVTPSGDPITPIHEALNWNYTRFGHQSRATLHAALFLNEDQTCWQAKLSDPLFDRKKAKPRKYETPIGNGSKAYLPSIPTAIRQRIADRHRIEIPESGRFWHWIAQHPQIPIVITEGAKKALSLLSLGYVAIALYGVNGGYRSKDAFNCPIDPHLIPDLAPFAQSNRPIILAFDQDEQPATRRRVSAAIGKFGSLFTAARCAVQIAVWQGQQGKGVDDLIVQHGAAAWQRALANALPLEHWRIWQRLERQLSYPTALGVEMADLSSLDVALLPDRGIVAIASAKGTGKTKYIHSLTGETEKLVAAGHRVALMRNLCHRLKLDYRGDLDKVNGEFTNGSAYALRLGLCVDSLLAIDPEKFRDCDLVIDEVVQVFRHLLTSSTCAKDGKRPALLARLHELIQTARRVIVADADLNTACLDYLTELRGDRQPAFLIRNTYQPQGYPVRFLQAADQTAIVAELIKTLKVDSAKTVLIMTDSKRSSKSLTRLILHEAPEKRVLLINAETSGGDCEREFIEMPDIVLNRHQYDVIIASPSVATGVSIETQGMIQAVYGIFTGASSTDADMAQALGRVREPVPRVVWCAKMGRNFCSVSRSTHPIELKGQIKARTDAIAALVKAQLTEAAYSAVTAYDFAADPHLSLYARLSAEQNSAMYHLNTALLVRLKQEGHRVAIEACESHSPTRLLLSAVRQEQKLADAEALLNAEVLSAIDSAYLEQKEALNPDEQRALNRFYLCEFYGIDPSRLSLEQILADAEGRRRGELLSLEAQLYPDLATDRTVRSLERQRQWNQGLCPWDISGTELRRKLREWIGLNDFLDPDREWTRYDLALYAQRSRSRAVEIQVALHFTISADMGDTQIIHQLLRQLGIEMTFRWSRSVPGFAGQKLRVYRIASDRWRESMAVLNQRQAQREKTEVTCSLPGSTPSSNKSLQGVDPAPAHPKARRSPPDSQFSLFLEDETPTVASALLTDGEPEISESVRMQPERW